MAPFFLFCPFERYWTKKTNGTYILFNETITMHFILPLNTLSTCTKAMCVGIYEWMKAWRYSVSKKDTRTTATKQINYEIISESSVSVANIRIDAGQRRIHPPRLVSTKRTYFQCIKNLIYFDVINN